MSINKIKISKAPVFTSPNLITLICTEKQSGCSGLVGALIGCGTSSGRDVKSVFADENVEAAFAWNGYTELAEAQKK